MARNFYFFCVVIIFVAGCRTIGTATDNTVIEHTRRIAELEAANSALAERLRQYDSLIERTVSRLEAIRGRAATIGDTASRIEYLFGEYERTVQQLIYELRTISGTVGSRTENNTRAVDCIVNLDWLESFENYYWLFMAGS